MRRRRRIPTGIAEGASPHSPLPPALGGAMINVVVVTGTDTVAGPSGPRTFGPCAGEDGGSTTSGAPPPTTGPPTTGPPGAGPPTTGPPAAGPPAADVVVVVVVCVVVAVVVIVVAGCVVVVGG